MFLLIFESLGTSELILIGIVALIFLGPRRMPEIARKIGRMMNDLRSTANDFKSTWEKEVDLEEETKALSLDNILNDDETEKPVPREGAILPEGEPSPTGIEVPAIKAMNKDEFEAMTGAATHETAEKTNGHRESEGSQAEEEDEPDLLSDKRNWL